MTTVLLVEDHVMMGQMITRLLREQEAIEIWIMVHSAEAALNALLTLPPTDMMPDLTLIDVALPGMNGIELVTELQRRYPDLPCLMVSGHVETPTIRQALAVGARGYVAKDDAFSLGEAVRTVLSGQTYMSPKIQTALAS